MRSPRSWFAAGAVLLAAPGVEADRCTIAGQQVTIREITVKPAAAAAFKVNVDSVAGTATVAGRATQLDIRGAIAFQGTAAHDVWYTAAAEIRAGMVELRRGAHVVGQRAEGGELLGRLVLHASDVLQGDNKQPDEAVDTVHVPCDRLSLDWLGGDDTPDLGGTNRYARPRKHPARIVLRAEPKASAARVTYRAPGCTGDARTRTVHGCIHVELIARQGAWLKVGRSNENAAVVGWVRASEVKWVPETVGVGHSYGCTGDHDHADGHTAYATDYKPQPAKIKQGTQIFAQPNVGAWATVIVEDGYRVYYAPGATWAEVTSIPGVTLEPGAAAFVPVSALSVDPQTK